MSNHLSTHQARVLNVLIKTDSHNMSDGFRNKFRSYSHWATKWPRGVQTLETMIKRQLIMRVITGEKVEIAITPRGREAFRINMEYAHRFRRY